LLASTVSVFLLALFGAALGMWLERIPKISRKALLASGVLLVSVSLLLVAPELAEHYGWLGGLAWMGLGFGVLWVIDHYVYPLCPVCSHSHDHQSCLAPLHGFAAPLIVASSLHSFMDGWTLGATRQDPSGELRLVFLIGLGLHKLPEGLALGAILRAALGSAWRTMLGSALAQSMTIAGGLAAWKLAPFIGAHWTGAFLGIAGGTFLYLGYHAVEAERTRRAPAGVSEGS
jgi:zinc transporter ZupT